MKDSLLLHSYDGTLVRNLSGYQELTRFHPTELSSKITIPQQQSSSSSSSSSSSQSSIQLDWKDLISSSSTQYDSGSSSGDDLISYDVLFTPTSGSSSSLASLSTSTLIESQDESILSSENFGNFLLVISYSLIVLVSLFGNIFVFRVMLNLCTASGGNGRTTTNVLILNLSISDLLLTCFNIPINIVRFVSTNWPFGMIICTLTPFIQSLSAHCSSITMMVIAFERYRNLIGLSSSWDICSKLCRCCCGDGIPKFSESSRAINHSTKLNRSSQSSWKLSVALIWLCSIVLSIPHCLYNQVVVYPSLLEEFQMVRCATVFPNEQNRLMLAILSPLSQYLLPIGLTALFYARIGCFLWRRSDPIGNVSENRRASILKRKRKRVKMLAMVVAVFATCWFPLHLYVTLIDFQIIQHHFGIYFVTHWIAMSSVCYNPFIYCWLNETFRRSTDPLFHSLSSFNNTIQHLWLTCCLIKIDCSSSFFSGSDHHQQQQTTITIKSNDQNQNRNFDDQHQIETKNGTKKQHLIVRDFSSTMVTTYTDENDC